MQPYQEASEEMKRQGELPIKALQKAGGLGLTATSGIGAGLILNRVLPLLNSFVPRDIAIKGLTRIDPRFGTFIQKALNSGQSFDQVRDFIKSKTEGGEIENKPKVQDQRTIIEQYSPELFQFLKSEIEKGRAPLEAGALAQLQEPFKPIIKKISNDHKVPFSSILQSVFGEGIQQSKKSLPAQTENSQMQSISQPQQAINNDQALLAALDKILKM